MMDWVTWRFIEMVAIVAMILISVFPHEAGYVLACKFFGVDTYIDWKVMEDFGRFRTWCVCVIPCDKNYIPKSKMEAAIISFAGSFASLLFIFGGFLLLSLLHMLTVTAILCLILISMYNLLYGLWEVRVNLKKLKDNQPKVLEMMR